MDLSGHERGLSSVADVRIATLSTRSATVSSTASSFVRRATHTVDTAAALASHLCADDYSHSSQPPRISQRDEH